MLGGALFQIQFEDALGLLGCIIRITHNYSSGVYLSVPDK